MKVAVVYHFFPHYRAAVLRELLASPNHEYVLVADERPTDPTVKTWTVEDRRSFISAPCRRLFGPFLLQRGLLGLGLRRDLDAIIYLGSPYFICTWISAFIARMRGKRVLFWTHGWTRSERGLKSWLRTIFYRRAHGLLLYGNQAREAGLARGFTSEQLYVIYNSLDYEAHKLLRTQITPEHLQLLKQSQFSAPELPLVICTARLTHRSRFDLLIEAQARLAHEGHRINVLLIGDGPEKGRLEFQAQQLGVPVRFLGACYDEKTLAAWTVAAHLTVSPGKVGLTAIHSLAYGTPVITHSDAEDQGPEWESIEPGISGDFFLKDDADDLKRVIRKWTSQPALSGLAREKCRQIIEHYYNPTYQRVAIERALGGEHFKHPVEQPLDSLAA